MKKANFVDAVSYLKRDGVVSLFTGIKFDNDAALRSWLDALFSMELGSVTTFKFVVACPVCGEECSANGCTKLPECRENKVMAKFINVLFSGGAEIDVECNVYADGSFNVFTIIVKSLACVSFLWGLGAVLDKNQGCDLHLDENVLFEIEAVRRNYVLNAKQK